MSDTEQAEIEQPFISHLLELRDRLLRMILAVLVFFVAMFPFANDIYVFIAEPLMSHLPEGTSMIATQVASPFLTPFKMSLVGSLFLAMPYILFQFWGFVAPGLYRHEKRLAVPLIASSIVLFYLGMIFAYYVVFPLVFAFLTGTAPEGVAVMTDIAAYLDFVITLFFAFGIAFEVPIATIVLVMMGVTTPEKLRQKRPYIIVGAFVVGMFLTPPDIISQTLLAMPMWILFEFGVFFSSAFVKKEDDEADDEEEATADVTEAAETAAPSSSDSASDSVMPATAAATAGASSATADEQLAASYPEDYVPLSDEEMEAELDRLDEDDDEEDDDDYDYYNDYDDHSGDGSNEASGENLVDVKLAQVMEYREEENLTAARALLYEVLEEGDESQIKVARNILLQLDSND
ncbi:MAG: twin-arginine translocase subunit TatC [Gammaproteobacteria bacterium]|nr:twin-arginine translocase subunit TatC [Gammaproteobacteria bacterium]